MSPQRLSWPLLLLVAWTGCRTTDTGDVQPGTSGDPSVAESSSGAGLDSGLGSTNSTDDEDPQTGEVGTSSPTTGPAPTSDGSDAASGEGDACPPSFLEGEWPGDLVIATACDSVRFGALVVHGDLVIHSGAEVHIEAPSTIDGALVMEPGSALHCVFTPENYNRFLSVGGPLEAIGTAEAPIIFDRDPVDGYNVACQAYFGSAVVEYAHFSAVHPRFAPGSEVRDSVFDLLAAPPNELNRLWVHGTGSLFEFNRFDRAQLRGTGFTARNNDFAQPGVGTSVLICDSCGNGYDCSGDRTESAGVVITDNVFSADYGSPGVSGDEVFSVSRDFGPIDLSDNYFPEGVPPDPNGWDGSASGCNDELGRYGGPLEFQPTLSEAPPQYGPRG